RYLITFWCFSFLGMFIVHYNIVSLNISLERGFFPRSMYEPMIRQLCYAAHVLFFICCSSAEVAIALERIISSINPLQYCKRSFDVYLLAAVSSFIVSIKDAKTFGTFAVGYRALGCVFLIIMDTGTVWLNFYAVRYCGRRFKELYGKCELSARYQVKEAYTMSVAMKPVYIVSYVIKFLINLACGIFYVFESEFPLLDGYLEFIYTCIVAVNGGLTTGLLIRSHPRIKMRFDEAIKHVLFRTSEVAPEVRQVVNHVHEANTYFSMLNKSWK
ncbi:hypothetical protein PMAYCL1PPCAC_16902, partial [Pristionchus mayeri]